MKGCSGPPGSWPFPGAQHLGSPMARARPPAAAALALVLLMCLHSCSSTPYRQVGTQPHALHVHQAKCVLVFATKQGLPSCQALFGPLPACLYSHAMQRRHAVPDWAQRRKLQQRPQASKNVLPANEENDGLAYDAEGHVYVDNAVTDAATAVGPFDAAAAKRVGVCHFPTTARDPWQVHLHTHAHALQPTGCAPCLVLIMSAWVFFANCGTC